MAEQITSIHMQAFRGVPTSFDLKFSGGRSSVILGDNGTGKSTISDAVEWYFNGKIEFLTKDGRRDAIRHSGAPANLETLVTVTTDGSLGGTVSSGQTPPERATAVGQSELFILRGRMLAEFMDKTKSDKWKVLAELLGLERIDRVRLDLQRVSNELEERARRSQRDLDDHVAMLAPLVTNVDESAIFLTFVEKYEAAGIVPPASLDQALDPHWQKSNVPGDADENLAVSLKRAHSDLDVLAKRLPVLDPIDTWNQFVREGDSADQLRLGLHRAADSLLKAGHAEPDRCPLCSQSVDLEALAQRIVAELASLDDAAQALGSAQQSARAFVGELDRAHRRRSELIETVAKLEVELPKLPESPVDRLSDDIGAAAEVDKGVVEGYRAEVAQWDTRALLMLAQSLPRPKTGREQAIFDIGVLYAQASEWKKLAHQSQSAARAYKLANELFTRFQKRQHGYFTDIFNVISVRTAEIYALLHPEGGIKAVGIEPVGEKAAELSVEFHGRKEVPPHRVLSESHLNSLGLALFLAMSETFNEQTGFLVLDDVVSSFDREHRGRLADLLANQFADKQLLVLTHDELFFTRIGILAPSWQKENFTSWSYEYGPRTRRYVGDRLFEDARAALEDGSRITAAENGRRALEEFLHEACERLEARLPFRRGQANDHRDVTVVMDGLRRSLNEKAKQFYTELKVLLKALEGDLQAALNVESHASQNATSPQEVRGALTRIAELRDRFTCQTPDCGTRVWHTGTPDSFRCKCGQSQFPPVA